MESLKFHAEAIQAAIDAAANDLCFLDDGDGNPLWTTVELNQHDEDGNVQNWIEISIPEGA